MLNQRNGTHRPGVAERNAEICRLYMGVKETPVTKGVAGLTLEQLGKQFGLRRESVRQIVKAAGLTPKDRFKFDNPEDQFLGLNVTPEVKDALKREASKRGTSVSALSTAALKKMLVDLGYNDLGAA